MVTAGYDLTLRIWPLDGGTPTIATLPAPLNAVAVAPGGEIVAAGATGKVYILSARGELKAEVEAGRFREDLYYRLCVFEIDIPPLRKRLEDLPALVEHLIQRHNLEMKTNYKGVDSATMRVLMSLPWKGNIRELDNVLERAMILGNGEWIAPASAVLPSLRSAATSARLRRARPFRA